MALVQGASRGIGLALVRRLLDHPRVERVVATSRHPQASEGLGGLADEAGERLERIAMDVGRERSVAEAGAALRERLPRLDLLLNVAGVLHGGGRRPEKRIEDLTADGLLESLRINAVGPALVCRELWPLLARAPRGVIGNVSARVGSIEDNRLGGWYAYRASKAAQNQLTRTLAIELGRRAPSVICVALHPGTTDTALSRPFQSRVPEGKLFSADYAAQRLLAVVEGLTPADSGRFFAWDGQPIPW